MRKATTITMKLISIILVMILASGCWSSNEIEDLSLYLAMGLDLGEVTKVEKAIEKKGGGFPTKHLLTMTVQIAPPQSSHKGDSGPSKLYTNVTQTGDSMFEILREFAVRMNRPVIAHHLKVIVISQKLAEEHPMNEFMDFLFKDNDIRPNCLIFVTTGKAVDTISFGDSGVLPAIYIRNLIENHKRTNRILPAVALTDVNTNFFSKQSFLLQNIITAEKDVKFAGAGIINGKSGKWMGYLDETNVTAVNWITGKVKGGLIKSYNMNDEVITFEIKSAKSKIKSSVNNGKISFKVNIDTEGRLIENWEINKFGSDPKYIEQVEAIFKETLQLQLEQLVKKLQEEFKVDVASFGTTLKIQHPATWKKVKENWDEEFVDTDIEFDIKVDITDFGGSTQ